MPTCSAILLVLAGTASTEAAWSFKDFLTGDWDMDRPNADGARANFA